MPNTYYTADEKAQCCSEGGGRHWTVSDTGGSLDSVASGNLVIIGNLVGVALTDYNTDTNAMVIDTVGCHELEVIGHDDTGADVAIAVGDWIIYDVSADALVRYAGAGLDTGDKFVGQAMAAVTSGATSTICVKMQPTPSHEF